MTANEFVPVADDPGRDHGAADRDPAPAGAGGGRAARARARLRPSAGTPPSSRGWWRLSSGSPPSGLPRSSLLLSTDLDRAGRSRSRGGIVMVGLVFAGISAVASQVTSTGGRPASLGIAAIGVAFVLRAIGDVHGPEITSVLTWLSPFGWAQATARVHRSTGCGRSRSALVGGGAPGRRGVLARRRDATSAPGLVAERLGRARGESCREWSRSRERRQPGAILSWGIAIVVMGVFIGAPRRRDPCGLHRLATERLQELFPTGANGAVASVFAIYTYSSP